MFEEGTIADGPNGPIIFRNGGWVPMNTAAPTGMVVPPSPLRVAEKQREQARQDAADARAERAAARADEAAARAAATAKTNEPAGVSQKVREEAISAYETANQMDRLIADMEAKFQAGPGATSGVMGAADYLPTVSNDRFDKAAQAVRGQVGTLLGFTGGQLNSIREAERAVGPYIPTASNYDATALDKIARLKELSNLARSRSTAILGGVPDANGRITPVGGGTQPTKRERDDSAALPALANPMGGAGGGNGNPPSPLLNAGGPAGPQIASGSTRTVENSKVASQIDAMMNAGASKAMIDTVLKQQGIAPISPSDFTAARAWMAKNPGKSYYGARSGETVDMSLLQRAAGSDAGAFAANMADAFTAGTSTALAGDQGRGALAAMNAASPNASVVGSLLGGVTGAGLAEAGLAARAPAALAQYAPRIADTAYGALSGFNAADEGQGGAGAATGALAGLGGGLLGQYGTQAAGSVLRGVTDPAAQAMRAASVPMTVGDALRNSGTIGRAISSAEQNMSSLPLVGSQIGRRYNDSLEGVNRAAFNIGAETTGGQVNAIGREGIQQLDALKSDAYSRALDPVRIDVANDPAALQDIGAALQAAQGIPQVGQNAADALRYRIEGGAPNGMMTGRDFQEGYRGLARDGRAAATGPYANEFAGAMREGQDALAGALERQNPGAFQGFTDANTANRRLMVLSDAVNKAEANGGMFTPYQLGAADRASANRLTGKVSSAGGNRPFAELADNAQAVFGNRAPNSGTAERALTALALSGGLGGGAGYAMGGGEGATTGAGIGFGTTLALALGGSKAAQSMAVRGLLDRPDLAVRIGEQIQRNARLGGAAGAGFGTYLSGMLGE